MRALLLTLFLLALPLPARAAGPEGDVDVVEHLGEALPADLRLVDQEGRESPLGALFDGRRPTLLLLGYYRCPTLCGLLLRGTVNALAGLGLSLGEDYRALSVSVDPRDTPAAAARKRESTLSALGGDRPGEWPFLVGSAASVARLAEVVGFRYAYDARTDQFAHPAVLVVLTPEGRISRYLQGVAPAPRDLRLALTEAAAGKTSRIVDRVILTCYRYDPATRAYGPYVLGFVRLGGAFILATVALVVGLLFWRERSC